MDFLYQKSKEGVTFTGLLEAIANEVTIVTAIHNIKSNKGSKTAGVDKIKMDRYLQMPKEEVIRLKIKNLCKEIRDIKMYKTENCRIAQIEYINSVIIGISEYIKIGISANAFHSIDRRVNNSCFSVWKRLYPKSYNEMQIRLKNLSNLPHRHEGYESKTFAIKHQEMWIGVTMAFLTHVKYETKPFNQKMTPYTEEGKKIYINYRGKNKLLPKDRLPIYTSSDIKLAIYSKTKMNFEYFMNREYAFNRDKGLCRCCKISLWNTEFKNCHHVDNTLPLEKINKVTNLAWVCPDCHKMIHNTPIPENLNPKTVKKIQNFREKLSKAKSVSTLKP